MRHLFKQLFTGGAVCDMSTCEHEGDRTARIICQSVDLGGTSAA